VWEVLACSSDGRWDEGSHCAVVSRQKLLALDIAALPS
jgi:hypothetical protein